MFVFLYGAPGTGKSAVCRALMARMRPSVYIDSAPGGDLVALHDAADRSQASLVIADIVEREGFPDGESVPMPLYVRGLCSDRRRIVIVTGSQARRGLDVAKVDVSLSHDCDILARTIVLNGKLFVEIPKSRYIALTGGKRYAVESFCDGIVNAFADSLGLVKRK